MRDCVDSRRKSDEKRAFSFRTFSRFRSLKMHLIGRGIPASFKAKTRQADPPVQGTPCDYEI
jgi:hypothetical protein